MLRDVFGDMHYEPRDVARKAITMALHLPFYNIETYWSGVQFYDENKNQVSLSNKYGLYAIYKDNVCLYVGQTFSSIYYRIYRFQKELLGLSRHDENHPAASKARLDGLKDLHGCKIKYIPHDIVLAEIDKVDGEYRRVYGSFPLDEYAAPLLKARYNTRKVYM